MINISYNQNLNSINYANIKELMKYYILLVIVKLLYYLNIILLMFNNDFAFEVLLYFIFQLIVIAGLYVIVYT